MIERRGSVVLEECRRSLRNVMDDTRRSDSGENRTRYLTPALSVERVNVHDVKVTRSHEGDERRHCFQPFSRLCWCGSSEPYRLGSVKSLDDSGG